MSSVKKFGKIPAFAAAFTLAMGMGAFSYAADSHHDSHHAPHWAYEGEHGPEHWGHMSKDFEACAKGKQQSPIDINGSQKEDLADITFGYKPSKLNVINNGHTVQVNADSGSSIKVDGVQYNLVQYHFHTPSEHTVGGKSFGMELHLVHKNDKGELAVVGVLIDKGKENAAYNLIWSNLPAKADEKKGSDKTVNADDLLPKSKLFYTYSGSLTTPPCSENVRWIVLKTPVEMSEAQIKAIMDIMKHNNRPVQPIHERKLKEDTATH